MKALVRKALMGAACFALVGVADAQIAPPSASGEAPEAGSAPAPPAAGTTDIGALARAIDLAQAGRADDARALQAGMADPVARKLVVWAITDAAPERLTPAELEMARTDLKDWPRQARRQAGTEKALEAQGLPPKEVIAWFKGQEPATAEGAMALAAAYRLTGRLEEARRLIRRFWTEKTFEAEPQRQMLARFGDLLTADDHIRRADMLLYGQQGPATRDMIALLPADLQTLAQARMALRDGDSRADELIASLPANLQDDPGLTFERVRQLRKQKNIGAALGLIAKLPSRPPGDDAAEAVWVERKALVNAALQIRDYKAAYDAAANNGLVDGVELAEAEFYAGWIALTKLKNAQAAEYHFAKIEDVGASPITLARSLYWRGRANEAMGDQIGARDFYSQGAQFPTTFYGQLAAERAGFTTLDIGRDPTPSVADRTRFEARELVRAARMLAAAGEKDVFRSFVLCLAEQVPDARQGVLLVDLAKTYGNQDLALRAARMLAQRGVILPERGYPVRIGLTQDPGDAEPAMVYAITRQESNFEPGVRSSVGARGMMQLMPATAREMARKLGVSYSESALYDADYNMRLGASYLGRIVDSFSGSYVMAAAAYNAGPSRPPAWAAYCGDPRSGAVDPVDFIECIPFSETRNYVMRVMESAEVYRARLNGGKAPLTLSRDLHLGR